MVGLVFLLSFFSSTLVASSLEQAYSAYSSGNLEEAELEFQRQADESSEDADVFHNLGVTQYRQGKFEKAKDSFLLASQKASGAQKSNSLLNLGNSYVKLGDLDAAKKSYQEAVSFNLDNKAASENLSWVEKEIEKRESQKKDSDQKDSDQKDSDQNSDQKDSDQKDSDQKDSDQKDSDQNSDQKDSDQKDSDQKDSDQKDSDQKDSDQKDSDQKDSDQKDSDQKDSDQKDADQKDADQKDADQKDADQKDSDEKESGQKDSKDKESDQKENIERSDEPDSDDESQDRLNQLQDQTQTSDQAEPKNGLIPLSKEVMRQQEAEKLLRSVDDKIGKYMFRPTRDQLEESSKNDKDW